MTDELNTKLASAAPAICAGRAGRRQQRAQATALPRPRRVDGGKSMGKDYRAAGAALAKPRQRSPVSSGVRLHRRQRKRAPVFPLLPAKIAAVPAIACCRVRQDRAFAASRRNANSFPENRATSRQSIEAAHRLGHSSSRRPSCRAAGRANCWRDGLCCRCCKKSGSASDPRTLPAAARVSTRRARRQRRGRSAPGFPSSKASKVQSSRARRSFVLVPSFRVEKGKSLKWGLFLGKHPYAKATSLLFVAQPTCFHATSTCSLLHLQINKHNNRETLARNCARARFKSLGA